MRADAHCPRVQPTAMSCVSAPVMPSRAESCGCHKGQQNTTPAVPAFSTIARQPSARPSRRRSAGGDITAVRRSRADCAHDSAAWPAISEGSRLRRARLRSSDVGGRATRCCRRPTRGAAQRALQLDRVTCCCLTREPRAAMVSRAISQPVRRSGSRLSARVDPNDGAGLYSRSGRPPRARLGVVATAAVETVVLGLHVIHLSLKGVCVAEQGTDLLLDQPHG